MRYLCVHKNSIFYTRWNDQPVPYTYSGVARPSSDSVLISGGEVSDPKRFALWSEPDVSSASEEWDLFFLTLKSACVAKNYYESNGIATDIIGIVEYAPDQIENVSITSDAFLGFDVATLELESALYPRPWHVADGVGTELSRWMPLWRLEEALIEHVVNEHGLIENAMDAIAITTGIKAFQDLIEHYEHKTYASGRFRILAVYYVNVP